MKIYKHYHELFPTTFGEMGLVWWKAQGGPRIRQVYLCRESKPARLAVLEDYPGSRRLSVPGIGALFDRVQRFLKGEAVVFDLGGIALEACGEFQRKVLLAEYGIPRGMVSTYGRIARHLGSPGGGRAVGRALAENPFPILIPCHRAVRAGGDIGGYQGGTAMKRALLEMEGIEFSVSGRVLMDRVYY